MRRCAAVSLVIILGLFSYARAQVPPGVPQQKQAIEAERQSKISRLWNDLNQAVTAQRESDALPLALQLLHAIPIRDAISMSPEGMSGGMDNRQQRGDALRALKHFNALDEYVRKVKAYYKEDRTNATYDALMAEVLALDDPKAATPFLEDAHKADATDTLVISELARNYESEGRVQDLYALVDPLLASDTPLRGGLEINLITLYARMNQLPRLAQLVTANLKPATADPQVYPDGPLDFFTFSTFNYDALVTALRNAHDSTDLIALARANMRHARANFGRDAKFQFLQFVSETDDHDAFGQAVVECLFPTDVGRDQDISLIGGNELSSDIPGGTLQDIVHRAIAAGQLGRLKDAGHAYLKAHPDDLPSEALFAFVLAAGHDPETVTFLPKYCQDLVSKTKLYSGLPAMDLYAIFGEILPWADGKSLLRPALETAEKIDLISQPQLSLESRLKIARLALKIPDQDLAQRVLKDATAEIKNPPPPQLHAPPPPSQPPTQPATRSNLPRPAPPTVPYGTYPRPTNLPSVERLGMLAAELIQANLPDDAASLLPIMTDPTKSRTESMPDNPALIITQVAEQALDANQLPVAKLFAQAAFRQLDYDWRNPQPIYGGVYFATTIPTDEVHRIGQLLLELGLTQELDDLAALLQVATSSGLQLDTETMSADIHRMQGLISSPPRNLSPAIWIDHSVPARGLDRQVAWDMTARVAANGYQRDTSPISVAGRDLPQLDGKLALQILAGPTADNLRQVKNLNAINARGTASVTLQPDDRFLSAVGQTIEAQPHIFIGATVPISMEPNLFAKIARVDRFSFADFYNSPSPKSETLADTASVLATLPGGPVAAGSYQQSACGAGAPRMELVGDRQPLTPGTVYLLSGWVRGGAQFGVRYLDQNGQKISDGNLNLPGPGSDWQFASQKIGNETPGRINYLGAPANAASFEPLLATGQNGTFDSCDLYLGLTEQKAAQLSSEQTQIMDGLSGAVSIMEAPQGKILAAAFQNGDIRCFDLATQKELGTTSHLPGQPVDIAFADQGRSVVAVNKTGDVLLRPTDGSAPGTLIYHAPWATGLLGVSSDSTIVAISQAESGQISVFNAATRAELSHFTIAAPPLVELLVSPDGKYVYTRPAAKQGEIWDAVPGTQLAITVGNSGAPLPNGGWFSEMAVAHFFHLPHVLKINGTPLPWWLLVKSNVVAQADGSSVSYSELGQPYKIHRFPTGPITAFCLSSQNEDTYTVSAQGQLSVWKLPAEIKFPPFDESTVVPLAVTAPSPTTPPVTAGGLVIDAPAAVRGFPLTTLSPPLTVTVRQPDGNPAANIDLQIQSDLPQAKFARAGSADAPLRSLKARTDSSGKIGLTIFLGKGAGKGAITIAAPAKSDTPPKIVAIESIDENQSINPPYNMVTAGSGNAINVTWMDKPDNRTAFVLERQIDGGPWRAIAILPETATRYNDTDVTENHQYSYQVMATNESKYGYPPTLPPLPDRLGDFLP